MSKIAEKYGVFNVYTGPVIAANRLIGVTDEMTLPNFEYMSEMLKLAGMLGEVDSPAVGQFKSAQIEIPFASISKSAMQIVKDDSKPIVLAAQQEVLDTETYAKTLAVRIITFRGMTKGINYGTVKKAGYSDAKVLKEILYYKDVLDGEVLTEIDKLNPKIDFDGKDMLEEMGKNI